MTTKYVLLEWVGRWVLASYNEDTAPLFESEQAAFEWARKLHTHELFEPGEADRALTRYRTRPITMPGDLFPVDDGNGWTGTYDERPCICKADKA